MQRFPSIRYGSTLTGGPSEFCEKVWSCGSELGLTANMKGCSRRYESMRSNTALERAVKHRGPRLSAAEAPCPAAQLDR